jgi:hypothetical protein
MRQVFLYSLLISITFGLVVSDATAGRFGGGRGFGMMHSRNAFSHSPRMTKTPAAAASQRKVNNRWRGALTGLLLGSVLTSLFLGHGFGGALLSWLLLGLSIYFIVYLLRRKSNTSL